MSSGRSAALSLRGAGAPVVVEVRGVEKVFRVPEERVDTLRERVTRPFGRRGARKLHALRGVSFDVHKGEFFGIVGKNGSGKSTLLKILASIYRADRGHVRVAGTIAPFIELGVGFNPELTARENVALNGVMMGLSRREAQRRLDAILDFAELRDFEHLKLKNYSSGMLVRLAFSIMAQADPDIMLIDEVLAVGDAAFAQRCLETFEEKRRRGTTLILVTHDMATVQSFCDRATVLHHGQQIYTGEPLTAAREYLRLNFAPPGGTASADVRSSGSPVAASSASGLAASTDATTPTDAASTSVPDSRDLKLSEAPAHVPHIFLELHHVDGSASAAAMLGHFEESEPISFALVMKPLETIRDLNLSFHISNHHGHWVCAFDSRLREGQRLEVGTLIELRVSLDNLLTPGRYYVECWASCQLTQKTRGLQSMRLGRFLVYGLTRSPAALRIPAKTRVATDTL